MQCNDLQDLVLAGVRWELGEYPTVSLGTVAPTPTPPAEDSVAAAAAIVPPTTMRTPTAIVPPISPIIPMSLETARAMASRPSDMPALVRMIAEFNHPLRSGATSTVLPHVAQNPNGVVIITDIPSGEDDASGQILSGAAGELLNKMIGAIGMSRDNVSLLPLIFWRTPGGRTPTRAEMDLCRPFVNRALELLQPRIILTLGTLAAAEIAGASLPRGHGVICQTPGGVQCMPIFHPNYLILKPTAKRDAWTALQTIENLLKNPQK